MTCASSQQHCSAVQTRTFRRCPLEKDVRNSKPPCSPKKSTKENPESSSASGSIHCSRATYCSQASRPSHPNAAVVLPVNPPPDKLSTISRVQRTASPNLDSLSLSPPWPLNLRSRHFVTVATHKPRCRPLLRFLALPATQVFPRFFFYNKLRSWDPRRPSARLRVHTHPPTNLAFSRLLDLPAKS